MLRLRLQRNIQKTGKDEMMTSRVILIICLLTTAFTIEITDEFYEQDDQRSRSVTIKYEGTQDEVEEFGKSIGLEFYKKAFGDWFIFRIPKPDINSLVPLDVPDIQISLNNAMKNDNKVKFIEQEKFRKRSKRELTIYDKEWPNQWYVQPTHKPNMNVHTVWEMGFTGKGIVVAVVDDGVDFNHPDLINNYNTSLDYDFITEVEDASHKEEGDGHGTQCAGLVGAVKDTNCIIGVAYESTMTGIRAIGNFDENLRSVASIEAMSLVHNYEYIDIYSNSWGPDDDGKTMEMLEPILIDALNLTINEGRNGKGTIYTFASGNGGNMDNCIADPYSGSMFTISVAAVNESGGSLWYSEPCTSILVAAFSGDTVVRNITTTGPNATCADDFSGTSAATPQVSGIIALTLQANPELTWRDIQHMIVELSNNSVLTHADGKYDFYTNGAGKQVSLYFGFGLINAKAMVENAPNWPSSPPRISCTSGNIYTNRYESNASEARTSFTVSNCLIKYLEHIEIHIKYNTSYRGDIEFYLLSPMGTESAVLTSREKDDLNGLTTTLFMSVHNWGEDPNGEWNLTSFPIFEDMYLHLIDWGIDLYGTATKPADGIPQDGVFGSPCDTSADCAGNSGCLKKTCDHCDNICVPCENNYHFNGEFCEQDCPPLPSIFLGSVDLKYTSEGIIAEYICVKGFTLYGGDAVRRCGSDGIWTGKEPMCGIVCGSLDAPANGNVSLSGIDLGSVANFTCNNGSILTEGDETITCGEYGEWNGIIPVCRKGCRLLESPVNGAVSFNDTFEGTEAQFTCNEGYSLVGQAFTTCQINSTWSSDEPKCLIDCGIPEQPINATLVFWETTEGEEAVYFCFKEFELQSGKLVRKCRPDGKWSGEAPECAPKYTSVASTASTNFILIAISVVATIFYNYH